MRVRWIAVVPSLVVMFTSAALAQAPAPANTSEPAPTAKPAAAGSKKVASASELVAQGEAILRRGAVVGSAVRQMLDDARKDADIIRITCLDDKLTQINANLRSVETRLDALRKAVDPDRQMHEHTVITVLGQKLQVLEQEAHQCTGQGMYETGETKVLTEIDTGMLPFEETPSTPPVVLPPTLPTLPPPTTMQSGFR